MATEECNKSSNRKKGAYRRSSSLRPLALPWNKLLDEATEEDNKTEIVIRYDDLEEEEEDDDDEISPLNLCAKAITMPNFGMKNDIGKALDLSGKSCPKVSVEAYTMPNLSINNSQNQVILNEKSPAKSRQLMNSLSKHNVRNIVSDKENNPAVKKSLTFSAIKHVKEQKSEMQRNNGKLLFASEFKSVCKTTTVSVSNYGISETSAVQTEDCNYSINRDTGYTNLQQQTYQDGPKHETNKLNLKQEDCKQDYQEVPGLQYETPHHQKQQQAFQGDEKFSRSAQENQHNTNAWQCRSQEFEQQPARKLEQPLSQGQQHLQNSQLQQNKEFQHQKQQQPVVEDVQQELRNLDVQEQEHKNSKFLQPINLEYVQQSTTRECQQPPSSILYAQQPTREFKQPPSNLVYAQQPTLKYVHQSTPQKLDFKSRSQDVHQQGIEHPFINQYSDNIQFVVPEVPKKRETANDLLVNGEVYRILTVIGRGGSSKVYLALRKGKELVAVKHVKLASVDEKTRQDYLNEIQHLLKMQHSRHVIRLYDHQYVPSSKSLYAVMERGDTDLSRYLKDRAASGERISPGLILFYWSEMLMAVKSIHDNNIIHRDLKPANFLLVAGQLKLIDFGIASAIQNEQTSVLKDSLSGTCNYMSPEAIDDLGSGDQTILKIGRKTDVWSLGCILYYFLYGKTPYQQFAKLEVKLRTIANPKYQVQFPKVPGLPEVLIESCRRCLIHDKNQRASIDELLQLTNQPLLSLPQVLAIIKDIVTPDQYDRVERAIHHEEV